MTLTFRIKQLEIPLFGIVESKKQERFLASFATPRPTVPLTIDDQDFDLIAEEFEHDVEGIIRDAHRYVQGGYRTKARGLQGGSLGTFGEVITFLLNRTPGREVVRVHSYKANGQELKGNRFPQPDFIVREARGIGALESKATEALDYQYLSAADRWMMLAPCSAVSNCRSEALSQLGYKDGKRVLQRHQLVVGEGKVVPFPIDFGIASAVLARDGRIDKFRSDTKYKTPPDCRRKRVPRDCWTCISDTAGPLDVVLVTMRNSPGHLPLVDAGELGIDWLSAYRRWTHSLWAYDIRALRESTMTLERVTREWLELSSLEVRDRNILRAYWGSCFRDLANARGLRLGDTAVGLASLGFDDAAGLDWIPQPLVQPAVVEAPLKDLPGLWRQAQREERPVSYCFGGTGRFPERESFSVRSDDRGWLVTTLSADWWEGRAIDDAGAVRIATGMVDTALAIEGLGPIDQGAQERSIPLRRSIVQVGESEVHLGWVAKSIAADKRTWRQWRLRGFPWWPFILDFPEDCPLWLSMLALGDPRVRLVVFPDGRGRLRIPRLAQTTR